MKFILTAACAIAILASETLAQGAGFTGIGSGSAVSSATGNAAPQSASVRSGVPTYAVQSRNAKRGRTSSERQQVETALRYHSSGWNARHTVPVTAGETRAMLRVVVVDGVPYAVLGKIRVPFLKPQRAQAMQRAFRPVVEQATGCRATSGAFSYGPNPAVAERLAYPITC